MYILYSIILYHVMLCYVIFLYIILYYLILSHLILCYIILTYIILNNIILYICSVYMYKNDSIPMTQGKRPPEYKLMEPKPTQASCFDMHNPTQLFT